MYGDIESTVFSQPFVISSRSTFRSDHVKTYHDALILLPCAKLCSSRVPILIYVYDHLWGQDLVFSGKESPFEISSPSSD